MNPVSRIKIDKNELVEYHFVHQYKQRYVFQSGEWKTNIPKVAHVEIWDEVSDTWHTVKKWKQYIFKKYQTASSALKGKNTWSKGRVPPNKGVSNVEFFGEEEAKKISQKLSAKSAEMWNSMTPETRQLRSKKLHEKLVNKSKTRTDEGKRSFTEKRKGKAVHTEASKKKISQNLLSWYKNDPTSRERVARHGALNGMFGRTHTTESRNKMSESLKKRYASDPVLLDQLRLNGKVSMLKQNGKVSKIETIVHTFLQSIGVAFQTQYAIAFSIFDIFVPEFNLLIEVQGDYWHGNPKIYSEETLSTSQRKKQATDKQKLSLATNRGFKLVYIWESEVKCRDFSVLMEAIYHAKKV